MSEQSISELEAQAAAIMEQLKSARQEEAKRVAAEAMTEVRSMLTEAGRALKEAGEAAQAEDTEALASALSGLTGAVAGARAAVKRMTGKRVSSNGGGGNGGTRPGALRDLVDEYLHSHAGEFTPSQVGKALERSSGAVAEACVKLVELGRAAETNAKPRKYTAAG